MNTTQRRRARPIRYISLFSGIECATLAVKSLGWMPICFSEIEPFPCAVLSHRFPDVPNVGDVTCHDWSRYRGRCNVVIGGSPCQAFSIAGRRQSLADERGNLTLAFVEAVNAIEPEILAWENVPGILSTSDQAFGRFLGALAGCLSPIVSPRGRKWPNAGMVIGPRRTLAWRVLNAQFFGVPQRRRRVFLVGCSRTSGFDPAEILFERESLCRDSPPGGKTGKNDTGAVADCSGSCGKATVASGYLRTAKCLTSKNARIDFETETLVAGTLGGGSGNRGWCNDLDRSGAFVAHTLRGEGFDASEDGIGRGTPLTVAFTQNQAGDVLTGSISPSIGTNANATGRNTAKVLTSGGDDAATDPHELQGVRRLTPRECERLQGIPDDHTLIPYRGKPAADGPRYKAVGNGMAVPCVGWVLRRIHTYLRGGC